MVCRFVCISPATCGSMSTLWNIARIWNQLPAKTWAPFGMAFGRQHWFVNLWTSKGWPHSLSQPIWSRPFWKIPDQALMKLYLLRRLAVSERNRDAVCQAYTTWNCIINSHPWSEYQFGLPQLLFAIRFSEFCGSSMFSFMWAIHRTSWLPWQFTAKASSLWGLSILWVEMVSIRILSPLAWSL